MRLQTLPWGKKKKSSNDSKSPFHHWSRRSNVAAQCCSGPTCALFAALYSTKQKKKDKAVTRQKNVNQPVSSLEGFYEGSLDKSMSAHLKPFVLQHFFDGHHLLAVDEARLVDHAKGAISYDLDVRV